MSTESNSGGSGHAIEDEGSAVTQRDTINFTGGGVTVTDDSGKTRVDIPSPPGGGEANTTSNVGLGEGLALPKVSVNNPFKSIIGELNKIIITGNANDVTITLGSAVELNTNKAIANGYASLDAGALVPVAQIPNLDASKIDAGVFNIARIPDITESKISDLQAYLLDITGENFSDLSDIPAHSAGDQILRRNVANTAFEWIATPGGGGGGLTHIALYKTADETINSDDILTDDADITTSALEANAVYSMYAIIAHDTHATPDFKLGFTVPTGCTMLWHWTAGSQPVAWLDESTVYNTGTFGNPRGIIIYGVVIMGANTGTFALQWAQDTSDANNTTLLKGTHIMLEKLS